MKKTNLFMLGGLILIFAVILFIFLFVYLKPEEEYFSDDPATWIEKDGKVQQINVDKVTRGTGHDGDDQLYLTIDGYETIFPYEGFYKGEYFEGQKAQNGILKIRIGSGFKPDDGVMEGYIIERKLNNSFEVFIFLDEDWRKQMPSTNIVWGSDYSKIKQFIFNKIAEGVYMDKMIDEPSRFEFNYRQSNTGIIVGNADLTDVQNGVTEGKTVIIFQ
jgi:hypothetical protein